MCAICREWFHPDCVGLKTEDEPEIFICEGCKAEVSFFFAYFYHTSNHYDTAFFLISCIRDIINLS